MRQQEVFNKIGNIINELAEQYDYLKSQPVPLDDLELELFTANANFLTDHLEILRKLNTALEKGNLARKNLTDPESVENNHDDAITSIPTALSEVAPIEEHFEVEPQQDIHQVAAFEFDLTPKESVEEFIEPKTEDDDTAYLEEEETALYETKSDSGYINTEDTDTHQIDLKPDTGHDHFSFIRSTEPDVIKHDFELSEADTFTEDEQQHHEHTVADAMAEIDLIAEKEIINEPETPLHQEEWFEEPEPTVSKQEDRPLTFNERMAAQNNAIRQAKSVQPISDLKSAITLNDKMLFVRDLFNGYSLAYSEAIEILNRFSKLEDAERFLSTNYEAKNNWADKPATKEKFYDLLKRRLPKRR